MIWLAENAWAEVAENFTPAWAHFMSSFPSRAWRLGERLLVLAQCAWQEHSSEPAMATSTNTSALMCFVFELNTELCRVMLRGTCNRNPSSQPLLNICLGMGTVTSRQQGIEDLASFYDYTCLLPLCLRRRSVRKML